MVLNQRGLGLIYQSKFFSTFPLGKLIHVRNNSNIFL